MHLRMVPIGIKRVERGWRDLSLSLSCIPTRALIARGPWRSGRSSISAAGHHEHLAQALPTHIPKAANTLNVDMVQGV